MTVKTIRPFDPRWTGEYSLEAETLRIALAPLPVIIDHIGSTAVDGLVAKPLVDILVQITDLKSIDDQRTRLEDMGYDARGEYGVVGRRYFSKAVNAGIVTGFHVHIFEKDSYQARRHIAFRDCLRVRPDLARTYANLKRSIADRDGQLPADYAGRKASYVDLIADVAVLQSDPTGVYKSIAPYMNPDSETDRLDVAYHEKWVQALQKEALLPGDRAQASDHYCFARSCTHFCK